jgi:hypothetical protein
VRAQQRRRGLRVHRTASGELAAQFHRNRRMTIRPPPTALNGAAVVSAAVDVNGLPVFSTTASADYAYSESYREAAISLKVRATSSQLDVRYRRCFRTR